MLAFTPLDSDDAPLRANGSGGSVTETPFPLQSLRGFQRPMAAATMRHPGGWGSSRPQSPDDRCVVVEPFLGLGNESVDLRPERLAEVDVAGLQGAGQGGPLGEAGDSGRDS